MKQKHFFFGLVLILTAGLILLNWPAVKAAITGNKSGGNSGGGNAGSGGTTAKPTPTTTGKTTVANTGTNTAGLNLNLVLKYGSRGAEVKALQHMLNTLSTISPLVEDGIFGPLTENKLVQYYGSKQVTLSQAQAMWLNRLGFPYNF